MCLVYDACVALLASLRVTSSHSSHNLPAAVLSKLRQKNEFGACAKRMKETKAVPLSYLAFVVLSLRHDMSSAKVL